jgi:pilus assembly protein CpaF
VHANAAADVPARVEALALGAGLGREAAHSQFASAIEAVLHLTRGRDGRRLSEVAVPFREPSGLVSMRPAVTFAADGRAIEGPGAARLAERLGEGVADPRGMSPTGEAG